MKPRRPNSTKTPYYLVPSVLVGMLLGATLTYMTLSSSSAKDPSSSLLLTTTTTTRSSSEDTGWHDISVWYGRRSGLGADPTATSYAQVHQDEIVLDLMGDHGYFVDLAANDAKELSNTLLLERHGWDGLCIEPNPVYWYSLSHRTCRVVGALVGSSTERVSVQFRGVYGGIVGRMDEKLANRKKEPQAATEQRYTVGFAELLGKFDVPKQIDYLNLDVEGAELLVMQAFPFDRYQIQVLTIERPNKQLQTLLQEHGYLKLKDLAWWGETLWAHESTGLTPQHPKIVKIVTEERN